MNMPNYDGIIETWKVNLIIHRAKRWGFKPHEIPDALQEAALVVLEFKYDPNHANGATESTVLTTIVDNTLLKMKRAESRYRAHLEQLGLLATEFSREEVDSDVLDVVEVFADLSNREKQVCLGLIDGRSIAHIARQMRCSWHTIDRIVHRLRKRFEELTPEGIEK